MAWTNRGVYRMFDITLRGASAPSTFYAALVTTAVAPTVDTNTLGELTQPSATNGYSNGGITLERSATGFPTLTENDTNDRVEALLKTLTQAASGGSIGPFRYVVITEDGGTVANRPVWAFFDLGSDVTIASGLTLSLTGGGLRNSTV